jgi:hypothetical protein
MGVSMGYIGYVKFDDLQAVAGASAVNPWIRADSVGLALKQSIEPLELIDARYDRTVYKLGPKEIDGDISFPAIHQDGVGVTQAIWRMAMMRDLNGDMQYDTDIKVKYAGPLGSSANSSVLFNYTGCKVNTFEINITQSEQLNLSLGVIGIARVKGDVDDEEGLDAPVYATRNSRVVTWNDAVVGFAIPTGSGLIDETTITGENIRSLTCQVNNNIDRFYSLNQSLFPVSVIPKKREITGTIETLGRIDELGQIAVSNDTRCSEFSNVFFGYRLDGSGYYSCAGGWYVNLPGVVFEIEQMSLSTSEFTTQINYHALTGAKQNTAFDTDYTVEDYTIPAGGVDPDVIYDADNGVTTDFGVQGFEIDVDDSANGGVPDGFDLT